VTAETPGPAEGEGRQGPESADDNVAEPAQELLRHLQFDLARSLARIFVTRALTDYMLGYVSGVLDAMARVPDSGSAERLLWRAADMGHRALIRQQGRCGCGMTGRCGAADEGMFPELVERLTEFGRDDLDSCQRAIEQTVARRSILFERFATGTYDRDELQRRVLKALVGSRYEVLAKEIAERLGDGVTGQQVGGVLKTLADQDLVVATEYRHPKTGYTVLYWQAAQFVVDDENT
jgi:hypothetical protein